MAGVRILARFDFPNGVVRFWAGSGPYMDNNGDIWVGGGVLLDDALQQIETAFGGDIAELDLTLGATGPYTDAIDDGFLEVQQNDVIGSPFVLSIQSVDNRDAPVGAPRVIFSGNVNNVAFSDYFAEDTLVKQITVTVTNRFNLRNLPSGAVYSDTDQRAFSLFINPGQTTPDRICERVPILQDKTIPWPDF